MVKMVDAIKDGRIVMVSEQEARDDDLFVLRTHETTVPLSQPMPLTTPYVRRDVRERPIMSHIVPKWHSYEPEYKKNNVIKELVDNFQWEIAKARKQRNLSRLQLANALDVQEGQVRMLEIGELPSDDFVLINKVQHYLGINLRRDGATFDAPMSKLSMPAMPAGPVYISKPDMAKATLADLQRIKEQREKAKAAAQGPQTGSLLGDDIELDE